MAFGKYKFKNELHPVEVKSMGFKEFNRDESAVKKSLARASNESFDDGDGAPLLVPKKGQTALRILPPYDETGLWYRELYRHEVFVDDVAYRGTCPGQVTCPICAAHRQLKSQGDDASLELAGRIRGRKRVLFNAVVYSDPSGLRPSNGVQVLCVGIKAAKQIWAHDVNASAGYGDITNISNGHDITIDRTGEKLTTEYTCTPFAKKTNFREVLATQGFNLDEFKPFNLSELLPPASKDELQGVVEMLGIGGQTQTFTAAPMPQAANPTRPGPVPPFNQGDN